MPASSVGSDRVIHTYWGTSPELFPELRGLPPGVYPQSHKDRLAEMGFEIVNGKTVPLGGAVKEASDVCSYGSPVNGSPRHAKVSKVVGQRRSRRWTERKC